MVNTKEQKKNIYFLAPLVLNRHKYCVYYGQLIKAFGRATVCYLQPVPFQRKKFFSRLLRNTAFAVLAQQSLHAGLGNLLYPSVAEKYIELGMEKELVEKLDLPPYAFVRPAPQDRTIIDHFYALTDVPTLIGLVWTKASLSEDTHGKTLPYPVCDIMLPDSEGFVKNWVRNASLLPEEKIRPPISDADGVALVLAHEVGHCDWQEHVTEFAANAYKALLNGTLSTLMEEEIRRAEFHSDQSAVYFAEQIQDLDKKEAMMDFLIASRNSFQYYMWNAETGYAYDYGPSLASLRNGGGIYTLDDFRQSRKELADYIDGNLLYGDLEDYTAAFVRTLEKFIVEKKDTALPLSMKRAELFISAIDYFAPDLMADTVVADVQLPEP